MPVASYDTDAFISYAHLDDERLAEDRVGWVANLHRALEVRVGQLLGEKPRIWRDPTLTGNEFLAESLIERLHRAASLIAVVSPRWVKAEWTRRELTEFWKAAEEQGGIRIGEKGRIFKVLKTPVPDDQYPPELRSLIGYEFFKIDPQTGRARELDEIFGPDAKQDFWLKLDDLAHDICALLQALKTGQSPCAPAELGATIFLAETTSDLREQREAIKRDLQQHGHTVLPASPLPLVAAELQQTLHEELGQSDMSIHLVGGKYGCVPEGGTSSLVEIQNEVASARTPQEGLSRIIWIPSGTQPEDDRQRRVLDRFRSDPGLQAGADLLETSLEDLKTVYYDHLKKRAQPKSAAATNDSVQAGETRRQLYVLYDQRDADLAPLWTDFLFKQGLEILRPAFDGDESDIRQYHQENLANCDGVLIIYGKAGEAWVRRKLRELQKSAGYGRTTPISVVGVWLLPPKTGEKELFRTHEATVIPQMDEFRVECLSTFASMLKR